MRSLNFLDNVGFVFGVALSLGALSCLHKCKAYLPSTTSQFGIIFGTNNFEQHSDGKQAAKCLMYVLCQAASSPESDSTQTVPSRQQPFAPQGTFTLRPKADHCCPHLSHPRHPCSSAVWNLQGFISSSPLSLRSGFRPPKILLKLGKPPACFPILAALAAAPLACHAADSQASSTSTHCQGPTQGAGVFAEHIFHIGRVGLLPCR